MVREVKLSRGYVAIVDDEDYRWIRHRLWSASGSPEKGVYAVAKIDGAVVRMHRLIVEAADGVVVDHINGNTLDNRRANLRICSHKENLRNARRRCKPGYKGVVPRGRRWRATIMVDGSQINLGCFATEIEAAVAYDRAAMAHFGEFAALNFSPDRDWLFPYQFKRQTRGRQRELEAA